MFNRLSKLLSYKELQNLETRDESTLIVEVIK
jgi:hypothetical protein